MRPLAQKLSEPPSAALPNVQHDVYIDSVQSAFVVQMRTVCVPLQVLPSEVLQAVAALHTELIVPVEQFGAMPPVIGMVPQQTSEDGQPAGAVHGVAAPASPLEPELLVLEVLEPDVELDVDPPELLLVVEPPSAGSVPDWLVPDEELEHAAKAPRERTAGTRSRLARMRACYHATHATSKRASVSPARKTIG